MTAAAQDIYLQRCIELARLGQGAVAPNPMVGAVLVHNNRIIGEGYHQQYGQAHAEVNCIHSVPAADQPLIPFSTLYVSLEPCAHFGKTPPCADLIIQKKIPTVVIGCRDPFKAVDGKGIDKLRAAGVEVIYPVLEEECRKLNKRFFTFHTKQRPYIILKWAQSSNGYIGNADHSRLQISDAVTNRWVHRWRSEEAAILVGTNTARYDNPALTTRLWPGNNPVRLVIDRHLQLPASLQLFNGEVSTIVFNTVKHEAKNNLLYYQYTETGNPVQQLCHALYQLNIQSVIVEGGAQLLQSFINENLYDEARVISSSTVYAPGGIAAPVLKDQVLVDTIQLANDSIQYFMPKNG